MSLFDSYEREFSALIADITKKINTIPELDGGTLLHARDVLYFVYCG